MKQTRREFELAFIPYLTERLQHRPDLAVQAVVFCSDEEVLSISRHLWSLLIDFAKTHHDPWHLRYLSRRLVSLSADRYLPHLEKLLDTGDEDVLFALSSRLPCTHPKFAVAVRLLSERYPSLVSEMWDLRRQKSLAAAG